MRAFAVLCVLLSTCLIWSCSETQTVKTVRVKAEGMGMAPAIRDGDELLIDRSFYKSGNTVGRFDIIAIAVPEGLFHYKRVIALPGESIEIRNGEVFIDGQLVREPFDTQPWSETNVGPLLVPENEYFVMGDNRPNSADSRIWTPPTVGRERILGKVVEVVPANK